MASYHPVMPHGDIQAVFSDIFFVTGTSRPTFSGSSWQYSRNMTILRNGGELTLVNTVRLDDSGLAKLDALGTVKHVVKLGSFHGMDDAFYRDRYHATQWALPGMEHEGGHTTDEELSAGHVPVPHADLFVFETSAKPEGILRLDREDGILLSCDSLQNWVEADCYFSEESALKMAQIGFIQPANIGPGWRMGCQPAASDFARLKALAFRHLLPAHGVPLLGEAHSRFAARFAQEFGV